ncbi:zinc metalloproteinase nas-14-like [Drosophila subpulchrella]|uniref:zinc metalloproteinase nas-14-like n=1 Tax=Drosophila subpulchrella TaxID=1486046 RepID=UPI0018A14183|nr:zinc metalloproteinase nas-14-like [Drosophila subpulchrella]
MFVVLLCISLGHALPMGDVETTGALVAAYSEKSQQNPEELGNYFEGDILIPMGFKNARNGVAAPTSRWPGGVVPYEIEGDFTTHELDKLNRAFMAYHKYTCVRFMPRIAEKDYVAFTSRKLGCYSYVGRLGGRQELNLHSPFCLVKVGVTLHEMMHTLGFLHEQNRHERNSYVQVISDNIIPENMQNFVVYKPGLLSGFGVKYDYSSVMHYSSVSFSRNGKPTLVALHDTPEARVMGQREGFSAGDLRKINAMYKCKVRATKKIRRP